MGIEKKARNFMGRIAVFFTLIGVILCMLMIVGQWQNFLESTQLLLLRLFWICCLIIASASLYFTIAGIYAKIKKRFMIKTIPMVLGVTGAVGGLIAASVVRVIILLSSS